MNRNELPQMTEVAVKSSSAFRLTYLASQRPRIRSLPVVVTWTKISGANTVSALSARQGMQRAVLFIRAEPVFAESSGGLVLSPCGWTGRRSAGSGSDNCEDATLTRYRAHSPR
jgi:hypothetical protein